MSTAAWRKGQVQCAAGASGSGVREGSNHIVEHLSTSLTLLSPTYSSNLPSHPRVCPHFLPKGDRPSESVSGLSKNKMIFTTNVWPDCKPVPTNVGLPTTMILSPTPPCKAVERDDLGHYLESHSRHYDYMLSAAACCNMACSYGPMLLQRMNSLLKIHILK